ncbi:MAG: hypothetical protein KFH87_00065 [Bacteroidetes bacterium]|nr:hypothetical protein [Bacteroidota bacterium]
MQRNVEFSANSWLIIITPVFLLFTSVLFAQSVEFSSSNLPIVIIETGGIEIPDEPKVPAVLGIIRGAGERNHIDDPYTDYHGPVGIELRGNSSSVHPLPSTGSVFVSLQLPTVTGGVVIIRDALGREVRRREFHAASIGAQGLSFHLRDVPNGLYHAFLHVGREPVAVTRILLLK